MRRSLILLLALALLSMGSIGAAVCYVNREAEVTPYTERRLYGDPAAGAGMEIEALLTCEGLLHWVNTVTLGPEIQMDSDFHFTPDYTMEQEFHPETLDLYCQSNMGMSSNGPIEFDEYVDTAWLADVLTVAAAQTPAGVEDYAVTVPLKAYVDYYEIMFDVSGLPWYWIEEKQFWETATEFFHVPVQEGDVAEITISKDDQGNVYSVNYNLPDAGNIYGSGIQGPDGCWYVLFTVRDRDGNPMEGAAPQGIYRVPLETVEWENGTTVENWEQVVESQVELVYATDHQGSLYAMEDDTRLLVTGFTEGREDATLFDWATMEPLQTFTISGRYVGNDGGWYETEVQNDHVATVSYYRPEGGDSSQWITVWALGDDGLYEKVIDCDTTAGMEADSVFATSLFDGERFLRASYEDIYGNCSLNIQVCDREGLQYAAQLEHKSQNQQYNQYIFQAEKSRPNLRLVP